LNKSGVKVITIKPGFVDTPMTSHINKNFLFAKPENIAKGIFSAIENNKDVVYLPFFWKYIMITIKSIPESIFKKLSL
jgi:short-subunit dehydrogenase